MASIDATMYNNSSENHHHRHHHQYAPASPRISFSNDFVESHQEKTIKNNSQTRTEPQISSDFEFSVSNYCMMPADELFSKGKILPFKEKQRTLREELLCGDDGDTENVGFSLRPPKNGGGSSSSTRWRGFLGLSKRNQIGSPKKPVGQPKGERKKSNLVHGSQSYLNQGQEEFESEEGGSNSRDMEIGI